MKEFVSGASVSVSDASQLLLSQRDHLVLFCFGNFVESVDSFVDGFYNFRENGVFGVIHATVGDAFESEVEHVSFNFCFVVLVGDVDALQSFFHDVADDFILVDVLDGFCFFENILSSAVKMVFEGDLL